MAQKKKTNKLLWLMTLDKAKLFMELELKSYSVMPVFHVFIILLTTKKNLDTEFKVLLARKQKFF